MTKVVVDPEGIDACRLAALVTPWEDGLQGHIDALQNNCKDDGLLIVKVRRQVSLLAWSAREDEAMADFESLITGVYENDHGSAIVSPDHPCYAMLANPPDDMKLRTDMECLAVSERDWNLECNDYDGDVGVTSPIMRLGTLVPEAAALEVE